MTSDTSSLLIAEAYERSKDLSSGDLVAEGILQPSRLFFPVITYPPPIGLPRWSDEQLFEDRARYDADRLTLYVHIPFCLTRCVFCHWVVTTGSDEDRVQRYLDALDREFAIYCERLGTRRLRPRSVLIGGGTPTYPRARQMQKFFDVLDRHVDRSQCRQFSMEAEPSTLLGPEGDARLEVMRANGVDRVSMGVQSFDDAILKSLGRVHNADVALRAIDRLKETGMASVSIDLIYGLSGQTIDNWLRTLTVAVGSGADAWQLYQLRILPHGDMPGKVIDQYATLPSRFPNVEDVTIMKMLGWMVSEAAGFSQHYTRIFSRTAEHISYYLHDVNHGLFNVAGLGISSWSNIGRVFAQNFGNDFPQYYQRIAEGHLPTDRGLRRDDDDEMRRTFILQLKNTHVELDAFERRFGCTPAQSALGERLRRLLQLELIEEVDGCIRMRRRGRFIADDVAMQFFAERHLPRRALVTSTTHV